MRILPRLALSLIAIASSSFAALTVSGVTYDSLSHSSVRIGYNWAGGYGVTYRMRVIASPGSCTGMAGGTLIYNSDFSDLNASGNYLLQNIGGLAPSTTYMACPEVTDQYNGASGAWYGGVGVTFTTLPLPAIHPARPIAPTTFDTSYPDMTGAAQVAILSDCSNLQTEIHNALGRQGTQGTVITIPHGTVCESGAPYVFDQPSGDVLQFDPANVNTSTSTITVTAHGFTDKQPIQFGNGYYSLPGNDTAACPDLTATAGQLFYAHVTGVNTFQVYCNAPLGAGGTLMHFTDTGNEFANAADRFEVAGWPRKAKPIVIRTDTLDSQFTPAGTRTGPAWASKMAIFKMPASLISDTPGVGFLFMSPTDTNFHYLVSNVRFMGIEFTTDDYAPSHNTIDPLYWHHLITSSPWVSNVTFDRVYVHIPDGNRVHRGFFWDGANMAVIDSYWDNLTYWKTTYEGLGITKQAAKIFQIAAGTHHENGISNYATLSGPVTVTVTGTASGSFGVYFDMQNGNALTVSAPAGESASCSGATCTAATAAASNRACDITDGIWPKTGSGEVKVAPIACVHVASGTIDSVQSFPQYGEVTSHWNTEGSNFMIGGQGPGPYIFRDNYSEGAGLTWHHDDTGGSTRTRGDYTYFRNYFKIPFKYMYGHPISNGLRYGIRQALEWKSGQRIHVEGNIFDGAWVEGNQASVALALTSVNGQGITDTEVDNNTFEHVPGVISFGVTENSQALVTPPNARLRVYNNLAWDVNSGSPVILGQGVTPACPDGTTTGPNYWVQDGFQCANGWFIQGPNSSEDVIVDHNTVADLSGRTASMFDMLENHTEGVQVTNNIFPVGSVKEGVFQDGGNEDNDSCAGKFAKQLLDCKWTSGPTTPSYVFNHNLLLGAGGATSTQVSSWYTGLTNYIPSDTSLADQGMFQYTGPSATNNNFRFKSGFCSGCGSPSNDGKDVGADIDQLEAAQGKVTLIGASGVTSSAATIAFVAPDSQACPVDYSSTDSTLINSFTRVVDTGTTPTRAVTLSGLSGQTVYYYRVDCAAQQPTGKFLTGAATVVSASNISATWANEGGDKVAQEEVRASTSTQNLTGTVINRAWDGTTVKLSAARNETVSFNLVLEAASHGASNVKVAFDTLTGPGGATIHSSAATGNGVFNWVGRPIELFYVRYLPVSGLSHFGYELPGDERQIPVRFRTPWTGQGSGTGNWTDRPDHDKHYPDIMVPYELVNQFNIAQGHSQSIWADVFVPLGTTPGTYTGTVTVTENGTTTKTVPVSLVVQNFSLPDKPTAKAMGFFDEHEVRNRYISGQAGYDNTTYFSPGSTQGQLAYSISDKYFELFHRHRMALIGDNDCGATNSPCTGTWGRYDGTLFTAANGYAGPGVGVSNGVYALGLYGSYGAFWNSGACGINSSTNTQAKFNTTADSWGSWFQSHVPNSELSTFDAIMYLCDEPSTNSGGVNQVANVETWSRWHAADSGAGSYLQSASTYDVVDSSQQTPDLQIAIEHAGFGDCGSAGKPCNLTTITQNAASTWEAATGKQLWGYAAERPGTGSVDLEDDGVALRQRAWAQYKKGMSRWFQWQTEPYSNMDFFNNPETWGGGLSFNQSWGMVDGGVSNNSENLLVYPGTDTIYPASNYGVNGPFASMRMKEWRRGIEDVDYLALAKQIDPTTVSSLVNTAVSSVLWDFPNTDPSYWVAPTGWTQPWSDNPDDWESYRAQLATIISTYCSSHSTASVCSGNANTVLLTSFGTVGTGGDDTSVFNTALASVSSSGKTLEIPAGTYHVQPLSISSNTNILLDNNVLVQATTTGYTSITAHLLTIDSASNVTITGSGSNSVFAMNKSLYTDGGEYRHCMAIDGSSNVTVTGIQCNSSGGDGLYVSSASSNITIKNSTFNNNARNALTLISVNGFLMDGCTLSNTGGNSGVAPDGPWDGVDMEPNGTTDELVNVVIQNTVASGNAGHGIMIAFERLDHTTAAVGVTINNVTSSGNTGSGIVAWGGWDSPETGPTGTILIENSTSNGDGEDGFGAYWYDSTSAHLTFQNDTVTGSDLHGVTTYNPDAAAFSIKRGGGATNTMGNITVTGLNITGTYQHYYAIEDFSSIGLSNIHITLGTVSGATGSAGMVNGATVSSNTYSVP